MAPGAGRDVSCESGCAVGVSRIQIRCATRQYACRKPSKPHRQRRKPPPTAAPQPPASAVPDRPGDAQGIVLAASLAPVPPLGAEDLAGRLLPPGLAAARAGCGAAESPQTLNPTTKHRREQGAGTPVNAACFGDHGDVSGPAGLRLRYPGMGCEPAWHPANPAAGHAGPGGRPAAGRCRWRGDRSRDPDPARTARQGLGVAAGGGGQAGCRWAASWAAGDALARPNRGGPA